MSDMYNKLVLCCKALTISQKPDIWMPLLSQCNSSKAGFVLDTLVIFVYEKQFSSIPQDVGEDGGSLHAKVLMLDMENSESLVQFQPTKNPIYPRAEP